MFVAIIVVCVFSALSLAMSFLTVAAAGRVSLDQRLLRNEIADRYGEMVDRIEELTGMTESALDCLVSLDAESSEAERHVE